MSHQFSLTSVTNTPQQDLIDFIQDTTFPCVGAKSALNNDRVQFIVLSKLGGDNAEPLLNALEDFIRGLDPDRTKLSSFIAIFEDAPLDEVEFESALWTELQNLHRLDATRFSWDSTVSDDPTDPRFSFSVCGHGMFIVGLNPNSSRFARRAPHAALVFNLQSQFQALKETGVYDKMQHIIRERDIALQGSVNPMLANFGSDSQARQYSGRQVPSDWVCPFKRTMPP